MCTIFAPLVYQRVELQGMAGIALEEREIMALSTQAIRFRVWTFPNLSFFLNTSNGLYSEVQLP